MPPYVSWPASFYIDAPKIPGYLLNLEGADPEKAQWWQKAGYSPAHPEILQRALFFHTSVRNYAGITYTRWGLKFIFEGLLDTPAGGPQPVRSVWQVKYGRPLGVQGIAELVTAHRF